MTGSKTFRIAWSFMAAVALLGAAVGPAEAQAWRHRGGWGDGLLMGIPLRALSLTADQQTRVKSILSASRTANRPIIQQLRQAQSELADKLLASPSADVSAQLAAINGFRTQLLQNSSATTAQVLGVLTPDQLAKAAQVRSELKQLRTQIQQILAPSGQ
jgi:Spy/CpxP family protein refolding chaperone